MTETPLIVAYCGPIAEPGQPARGGYEAANRRLIDDLRALGVAVQEYPYARERRSRLGKYLGYGAGFLSLAFQLVFHTSRNHIFHITPLRDRFSLPEALLCRIAKTRGAKLVVDIRAGTLARDLHSRNVPERTALLWLIRNADLLAYEGAAYKDLLAPWGRQSLYLPNYVDAVEPEAAGPTGIVHLAYVGRVVAEKGVETVIDCLRALLATGTDARLTVIGRGEDRYTERLRKETADLPVDWRGAVPHGDVQHHLRGAHFFVFPTRHYGEGHSNALSEAMSGGLVPLVADSGFNSSIVGDAGIVLPKDSDGEAYASALQTILAEDRWIAFSRRAQERTAEHFIRNQVVPTLLAHYRKLLA